MTRLAFAVLAVGGAATAQVLNLPFTTKVTTTITVLGSDGAETKNQSVQRIYRSAAGAILYLSFVGGGDGGTPAIGELFDIANSKTYQINYVKRIFTATATGAPSHDQMAPPDPRLPVKVVNGVQCSMAGLALGTSAPVPGSFACQSDVYRFPVQTNSTAQDGGATSNQLY